MSFGPEVAVDCAVTDVSGRLRAAREQAGLSLEDISVRTKIKPAFLQAIEQGAFERLPGAFFARAFVRTYAREVGVPPDEIVGAYDARFLTTNREKPAIAPRIPSRADTGPFAGMGLAFASRRSAWPMTIALGGAILIVLSVMNRTPPDTAMQGRPVGMTARAEAAVPPAPPPVRKAPDKLTIEIQPSRVMWVAGTADGKRVIYRLVEPGERVRIDAQRDLWFRVGDAGAFVYSINGSPAKPLGESGEVREFRITRETYQAPAR